MNVEDWLGKDNQIGIDIWKEKYCLHTGHLKTNDWVPTESFDEHTQRIAGINNDFRRLYIEKKFLPGGRTIAGRGLQLLGTKITYSNCYVLSVDDSIESIYKCCADIARTYSYGGGCGIDISKLRPRGADVHNAAKTTTGAVSFMKTFDIVTGTIGQEGRRGALMISLDIRHPDIMEFVNVKANTTEVTNANISVRVNDEFMKAVESDSDFILKWPCDTKETLLRADEQQYDVLIKQTSDSPNDVTYFKKVKARKLFMQLVHNNWDYGEPGILFWDNITEGHMMSRNPEFSYAGVNPCAEEPLPNGGSCNLGSMNLAAYDWTKESVWKEFAIDVQIATWALNQILYEGEPLHPLSVQRETVRKYRQIGLGLMGFADACIQQGITYGSKESLEFANNITRTMLVNAFIESCELNHNNEPFEGLFDSPFYKERILPYIPKEYIGRYPRNSQLLTIAPTGTLSTMLGVSGGAEPIFAMEYERTTKSLHGKDVTYKIHTKIAQDWLDSHPDANNNISYLPEYFVSAADISVENRVLVQSALQQNIDASISSTINLPKSATEQDVYNIYMSAWKNKLKGVTVFRDGCKRASILSTQPKQVVTDFTTHSAPKRPKVLEADCIPIKAQGEGFLIFVGLYEGKPYEVFALPDKFLDEARPQCRGTITKVGKRHYRFDSNECASIENIAINSDDDEGAEYRQLTMLVSGLLRHGMPIDSIMKLVNKCNGIITSMNRALWKVLIKYAPKSDKEELCPDCGKPIIRENGCKHCTCGWSACMTMFKLKSKTK